MIGLRLKQALRGLFTAPYSSLKHSICLTLPNNKDALLLRIPLCYTHAHEHTFIYKQARTNTCNYRCTHALSSFIFVGTYRRHDVTSSRSNLTCHHHHHHFFKFL